MDKILVEIDIETADKVFYAVLKRQYKGLSPNIGGYPTFAMDEKENQRQYRAYKKAFKLVAEYNGIVMDNGVKL
jgi:hypothetical protein